MSSFIVNKTLDFIKNYSNYSNKDLNKIKYGIEGVYLTISKIIIIILIGIIFNYLDIVIITLIFFNILRFFAFGLHASKSWQCLILSIIEFNILPYILNNIAVKNIHIIIFGLISFLSFLLFAPSDTEKRPLTNKRKRLIRKVCSLLICILFIFTSYKLIFLRVPILTSLIIESLMINPFIYKILGLKYNNYKNGGAQNI